MRNSNNFVEKQTKNSFECKYIVEKQSNIDQKSPKTTEKRAERNKCFNWRKKKYQIIVSRSEKQNKSHVYNCFEAKIVKKKHLRNGPKESLKHAEGAIFWDQIWVVVFVRKRDEIFIWGKKQKISHVFLFAAVIEKNIWETTQKNLWRYNLLQIKFELLFSFTKAMNSLIFQWKNKINPTLLLPWSNRNSKKNQNTFKNLKRI